MDFDFQKQRDYNARMATLAAARHLVEKGYKVVSVNLYGSQNYDCDTPESDYDFKAIIVPALDDIVLNKKPVSHDIEFNGGLIDIKDIRLMFDNYKKQNVNFIETLFTRWFWVAPDFTREWNCIRDIADFVAFADPAKSVNCMIGMAKEKEHALSQPYPSKIKILEKYGFDPKQLMHIVRLRILMESFLVELSTDSMDYGKILIPEKEVIEMLMDIKLMKTPITPEQAKAIAEKEIGIMEDVREAFKAQVEDKWGKINQAAYDALEGIKAKIMKKAFVADLKKDFLF